jgi:hypothetical protein
MDNSPKLEIEFNQNLKNFVPEITARIIYLSVSLYWLNLISKTSSVQYSQSYFIAGMFVLFNILLFLLTIYGTKRRRLSITKFIEMRLKAHEDYRNCKFIYSSDFLKTPFYILVVLSSLLFAASIFVIFQFLGVDPSYNSLLIAFIVLGLPFVYGLILRKHRMNFISKGIVSVSFNGNKFSDEEVTEFMSLLYDDINVGEVHYLNDGYIYEIEKRANIFKQRVETLLIEAVFIGALTFGTFVELTSPESIISLDQIQDKELKLKETQNVNSKKENFIYGKELLFLRLQNDLNLNAQNIPITKDLYNSKIRTRNNKGVFKDWAIQRQYTIFSFIYKKIYDETRTYPDVINLGSEPISKTEDKKNFFDKSEQSFKELKKETIQKIRENKNDTIKALNDAIQLPKADSVIKFRNQFALLKYSGNSLFDASNDFETREKIKRILLEHDYDKYLKYISITKNSWDEQEYIFLIAIGSIICSVLYISVLIKRFAVIMKIESLFSDLKVALVWNRREEDALANEMRIEAEDGNKLILEKFQKRRFFYSEKLQIQLALCELNCTKIETNIQIISLLRHFGLIIFFLVLLIGTMMLDPKFTIILGSIIAYSLLASSFMQEGSSIRSLWHVLSGSTNSRSIKNED